MRVSHGVDFEFLVDELGGHTSRYADGRGGEVLAAVRELVIEVVVLMLSESVHSGFAGRFSRSSR